jgi:hypothetical protein
MDGLIEAAKLAEDFSASRHKQIDLLLLERGVLVKGQFLDAEGTVLYEYKFQVEWPQIWQSRKSILCDAIRLIDEELTAHWRAEAV